MSTITQIIQNELQLTAGEQFNSQENVPVSREECFPQHLQISLHFKLSIVFELQNFKETEPFSAKKRREEIIDMPIMKTISQIRYFQF
jgi:hypothetical protein